MNFFEQQLRNVFADMDNAQYIGRACYIPLDDDTKVKARFVTTGIADHYNALKLSVINRKEGVSDSLMLCFKDYFTRSKGYMDEPPHIWTYDGKTEWYGTPLGSELQALSDAAHEYVELFSPEESLSQSMDM